MPLAPILFFYFIKPTLDKVFPILNRKEGMSNFGIRSLPILEIGQTDPLFVEEEESDDDYDFSPQILNYEKQANSLLGRCFLLKTSNCTKWSEEVKKVIFELNFYKGMTSPSLRRKVDILVKKLEADLKFSVVYELVYGVFSLGLLMSTTYAGCWALKNSRPN